MLKLQKKKLLIEKPKRTVRSQFEIDFNELKINKKISEGTYGKIYRGRWRGTIVALKILKSVELDKIEAFKRECYTMEELRHPNIVEFLGASTTGPNYSIVLEYCANHSLYEFLQNKEIQLNWQYKRKMALDIAKAMNYLHMFDPPILHRDLKSLNLLVTSGFRIKLADFGWTRTKQQYMTTGIGTYPWMSPELINGEEYTEKADVYAYAIILWEIATRKIPYKGIDQLRVAIEVVNHDMRPEIPKYCKDPFAKLIIKCWDKHPSKRPSFKQIIKELERMRLR